MNIDVRDTEIIIDSKVLAFPASFSDLQVILGEARIVPKNDRANYYIFDKLGITFCDVDERYLKRRKAFIDKEHLISYVTFFIDDTELMNEAEIPAERFNGNITFFGREWDSLKKSDGSSQYFFCKDGEYRFAHIKAIIRGNDDESNYTDGRFTKTLYLTFAPERPKSTENYNISAPQEDCVTFTNLNFKLAVVQELMYNMEILKPYFDIYDYLKFKKSKAKTETEKNIKAAIDFFKNLPVPQKLANELTEITMDGGNEIYGNIAPLWDGEDGRFDLDEISPDELKCFPNLRKIKLMSSKPEKIITLCEEYNVEVTTL
ncbi:DUF6892 domain-containing protein [Ruminococcus bicirculans (ex Wegman et al. 2014)]|uniref:DUF6892 domain-containing protein n=2 Tax=Ruminococcus bicirculans (ex Wegman et al. 2014) TaxID=1160721 RepID=UPI0022E84D75|nr:hypothetical protein [Ruminococcus bicirculans (ex Wegman et al. 2014)]